MSAVDWFWTGCNNAVDRQRCGVRFEVGALKVATYWIGVGYGWLRRLSGTKRGE